ncbi:MAG: hypothetical protein UZ15_CFX003002693 [Chloroflexi bacterium OLB15]|nr:MAG: hypothetical protein UZ15_CFX003002693 [Chloroflexi bacterium OLB15]
MIITTQMFERFYAQSDRFTGLSRGYFEREETLLKEIHEEKWVLWVKVRFSDHEPVCYSVSSADEIVEASKRWFCPELWGVKPGYELEDAQRIDYEKLTVFIGDFDEYGAEAGLVMNTLYPRPADAPPDRMTQELIEEYGLDENGNIRFPLSEQ